MNGTDDGSCGAAGSPCATLAHALDSRAVDEDVLYLSAGTHVVTSELTSSLNNITVVGEQGETAVYLNTTESSIEFEGSELLLANFSVSAVTGLTRPPLTLSGPGASVEIEDMNIGPAGVVGSPGVGGLRVFGLDLLVMARVNIFDTVASGVSSVGGMLIESTSQVSVADITIRGAESTDSSGVGGIAVRSCPTGAVLDFRSETSFDNIVGTRPTTNYISGNVGGSVGGVSVTGSECTLVAQSPLSVDRNTATEEGGSGGIQCEDGRLSGFIYVTENEGTGAGGVLCDECIMDRMGENAKGFVGDNYLGFNVFCTGSTGCSVCSDCAAGVGCILGGVEEHSDQLLAPDQFVTSNGCLCDLIPPGTESQIAASCSCPDGSFTLVDNQCEVDEGTPLDPYVVAIIILGVVLVVVAYALWTVFTNAASEPALIPKTDGQE